MSFNLHLNDIRDTGSAERAASENVGLLEQYILSSNRSSINADAIKANSQIHHGRDKCASLNNNRSYNPVQPLDSFLLHPCSSRKEYFAPALHTSDTGSRCPKWQTKQSSKRSFHAEVLLGGELTVYSRQICVALKAGKSVWL